MISNYISLQVFVKIISEVTLKVKHSIQYHSVGRKNETTIWLMSNDFILFINVIRISFKVLKLPGNKNKHPSDRSSLVFLSPFLTYIEKNIKLIHLANVY